MIWVIFFLFPELVREGVNKKKSTFQGTCPLSSDSPQPLYGKKGKGLPFSLSFFYKYFLRTCSLTGVIIQINGLNKKVFLGHLVRKKSTFFQQGRGWRASNSYFILVRAIQSTIYHFLGIHRRTDFYRWLPPPQFSSQAQIPQP